jgi:hypothetical protein
MVGSCSTHGGDEKCVQILLGKPEGKGPVGYLDVEGRIILKWILGKQGERLWTELDRDWWQTVVKNSNKPWGSIKGGEFLD